MDRIAEQNTNVAGSSEEHAAQVERVEQVLKSLTKLIHGKKLYAENNPRLQQFREEFHDALARFFKFEEPLVLTIDQYVVRFGDVVVYENERREESIAFLLHKDGVGELSISAGAIGDETDQLVEILTDEYHSHGSEEDVVTRFWNADFACIGYRVLDDYLSAEYGQLTRPSAEPIAEASDHAELLPTLADKGRVIVSQSDTIESIDGYLKKLILRTCTASDPGERETYFQDMVGSFFSVSNEEMMLYQQELAQETRSDGLAVFAQSIMVFTLLQENPSAVRDISGVLTRMVDFAAEEREPGTLARLLELVREFRASGKLPDEIDGVCAKLELRLMERGLVEALGEKLQQWGPAAEDILRYLRAVGRRAVDPLLRVLHHVAGKKLHQAVCDVLVAVDGDDIEHLIERLDIDQPQVAFDAVYLASQARTSRPVARIQEMLFYPDRQVKEEVVALLSRYDDPIVMELLLGAIGDEDKHVRCRAMEAAAARGDERVRERLTEVAFGKELASRDGDEQEIIFKTLGMVGDAGTVEHLQRFVEKKGLLQFGKGRENKALAVRALEHIADPAALEMLSALSGDTNTLVQTRAKRAHAVLKARLAAGDDKETES
ncbi:MAG: HEAT repeat domain-containing protein [Candidatus Krumholzibacteria bacterium]|nr:HEAT repeat domain-containing protein [Candidatus Krumholzibacteria bacterium]